MWSSFIKFWKTLYADKWLILLCLALGFLSWQGIRKNTDLELTVPNIAIQLQIPEGWVLLDRSATHAEVLFRGTRDDLRYLNSNQLRIVVPVTHPVAGRDIRIPLTESLLQNPSRAHPVRFSPAFITLRLDTLQTRTLPVKVSLSGSLPEDIELERVSAKPATVRITGPARLVAPLQNLRTETVNLEGRNRSFSENVRVESPRPDLVKVSPQWVSVSVDLAQPTAERTVEAVPVHVLLPPDKPWRVSLRPSLVSLTLKGPRQRIEQLRLEDLIAFVNCADLDEASEYDLPVTVRLPSGVKRVKTEPAVVHVTIRNE